MPATCQYTASSACHGPLLTRSSPRRQVLDDSTDPVTRELVDESVADWRERGINVECLRRTNRQGYKAGAMKEVRGATERERWGMERPGLDFSNINLWQGRAGRPAPSPSTRPPLFDP